MDIKADELFYVYMYRQIPLNCLERIEVWWCIYASVPCVIIGSGNGLSPVRCQAITWINAALLSIAHPGANFNEGLNQNTTISIQ